MVKVTLHQGLLQLHCSDEHASQCTKWDWSEYPGGGKLREVEVWMERNKGHLEQEKNLRGT